MCRTKGVILAVYNCGIICSYKVLFGSESLTQVARFYLDIMDRSPKYLIYDDACHLKPFMDSHCELNENRQLSYDGKVFAIDRLHFKNHTRKICKNFHCDKYPELSKVNSMACEETNFWFGNYKYKHML